MHDETEAVRVAHEVGNEVSSLFGRLVSVSYPDVAGEPFVVVRFDPERLRAVPLVAIVNHDLTYQIEAASFTMFEESDPRPSSEVVGSIVAKVASFAEQGLAVVRKFPAIGRLSPTRISTLAAAAGKEASARPSGKIFASWAAWKENAPAVEA